MAASVAQSPLAQHYAGKASEYFDGARHDFLDRLKRDPNAQILEIGCGTGLTGELALSAGRCGAYVGVELMPAAAEQARSRLSETFVGNIESMDLPHPPGHFDALIMSEVLEHLVDPWAVLRKLAVHLKPDATVLASSPNIAHWTVIRELVRGRFDLRDAGVMDRTHLRWFTPKTYRALFEDSGFRVVEVWPHVALSQKQKLAATILGGRTHLFMRQICLEARAGEGPSGREASS